LTGPLLFDIIIRQASSTNRLRRPAHIGTDRQLIEAGAADAPTPLDATPRYMTGDDEVPFNDRPSFFIATERAFTRSTFIREEYQ